MSGNMDWLHHDRIVAFTSLRFGEGGAKDQLRVQEAKFSQVSGKELTLAAREWLALGSEFPCCSSSRTSA